MNIHATIPRPHRKLALVVSGLLLSAPQIWAQATPTPPTTPPPAATAATDEETVVLSPFEVDASKDTGYYAENTLAGSRLNTKVSDLAASITVVTKRQLEDTASYNLNDVFLYEANTEGTGNYTEFTIDSRGAAQDRTAGFQGGAPSLPSGPATANRVRGISTVDRARDYYPSVQRLEFDAYNTDSIEINRGPNSLLFGLGTPAGIANQSAARARLSGRGGQVGFVLRNDSGYRATINYNLPLIEDKLAFYVAAVQSEVGYARKPSEDRTNREYVAVTYKPFQNTTLRANYESYHNDNRRPNSLTPRDFVSPWIAAGKPSWDPINRRMTINGVVQPTQYDGNNAASILALQTASGNTMQFDGNTRPVLAIDQGQEIGYWVRQLSASPSQAAVQAQFFGAAVPPNFAGDPFYGNLSRQASYQQFRLTKTQGPQTQRNLAPAGTAAGLGFQQPGVTDQSLYDWEKINILSGNFAVESADVKNFELEQQIFSNLNLQVGYFSTDFRQHVDYYISQQTGVTLYVDTNQRLLDGVVNPNFGRPFIELTQPDAFDHPEENTTGRATLAYTYDFTKSDGLMKWLGHGRLMGLAQRNQINRQQIRWRPLISGNTQLWNPMPLAGTPATPDVWAGNTTQNAIERRFYVGDGTTNTVTQDPGLYPNGTRGNTMRWFNPTAAGRDPLTNLPGAWVNENITVETPMHFVSSQSRQYIDSKAFAMQNYFLDDRIIATVGWRTDDSQSKTSIGLRRLPNGYTATGDLNTYGTPQVVSGDTSSLGVVVKPLRWLSLHYNESDNFQPAGLNTDYYNVPLPFPSGKGKDYGVSFTLLDDKLYARLNWYEASQENARGAFIGQIVSRTATVDDTLFRLWAQLKSGSATNNSQAVVDILQLPNDYGQVPGRLFGQIPVSTTQSVDSEGLEFSLTYNPKPNWNIKFTAGQQKTVFTNVAPEWLDWIAVRKPIWESQTGAGALPAFWLATGNDLPGNNTLGATQTVRDWYATNVDAVAQVPLANQGRVTPDQREWRWNVLTNYTFNDGMLKGLGLGGAIRWEDAAAIGYLGAPADPDGVIRKIDVNSPVFGDTETHLDLWFSYRFNSLPFVGDKVKTKVQLNIRNAEQSGELLPVGVNPAGQPIAFRIVDPRSWDLGITFDF